MCRRMGCRWLRGQDDNPPGGMTFPSDVGAMVKLVSWNMAHREKSWRYLLESDADIALLQEAAAAHSAAASRTPQPAKLT